MSRVEESVPATWTCRLNGRPRKRRTSPWLRPSKCDHACKVESRVRARGNYGTEGSNCLTRSTRCARRPSQRGCGLPPDLFAGGRMAEQSVSSQTIHKWYARPVLFVADVNRALHFYV